MRVLLGIVIFVIIACMVLAVVAFQLWGIWGLAVLAVLAVAGIFGLKSLGGLLPQSASEPHDDETKPSRQLGLAGDPHYLVQLISRAKYSTCFTRPL